MASSESIQIPQTSEILETQGSQIDPQALFNEYKNLADQAHDQQALMKLREELILQATRTDDQTLLAAIEACNHYVETKCNDVPEVNYRYCNELFAHGFFCFFGTVIIILTLFSVLNPTLLVLAPAFLVMSLSIGYTFKNAVQYLSTPNVFKQTTELTKLILSLAITAEIFFYNLSEVENITFQSSGFLATIVLSLGLITLLLSTYIFVLAIKARQEISSYLKYKEYFNQVAEIENRFIVLDDLNNGKFDDFIAIGKNKGLFIRLNDKDKESFKKQIKLLINDDPSNRDQARKELIQLIGANDTHTVEKAIHKTIKFEAFKTENKETSELLKKSFRQSMPLVTALDQKTYDSKKITLYLRGIIGAMGESSDDQKPSRELSNHCLAQIKSLLQNKDGEFIDENALKCYTILELEARLVQMDQPYIKNIPYRLTADALLIFSSMALHIMIGFGVGATIYFTAPIFALGVLSLILFTFNEYRDFKRKHFILGISTTYISFIMMMVIFVAIVGGIGFNPLFLGFGIPLVLLMAYAAKKFWLEPKQDLIVADIEQSIQKLTEDKNTSSQKATEENLINKDNVDSPHPDQEQRFVTPAEALKPITTEDSLTEEYVTVEEKSVDELDDDLSSVAEQPKTETKTDKEKKFADRNEGTTDEECNTSSDEDEDGDGDSENEGPKIH